jgi:membrane protein
VGIAGFLYTSESDRAGLVDEILDQTALSEDGRDELESVVNSVVEARGPLGILGLAGAAFTGSALFATIRQSLNVVFEVSHSRPFWKAKLIDLALVLGFALLLVLSVAATFALAFLQRASGQFFGAAAPLATVLLSFGYVLAPLTISFVTFSVLYARVPHHGPHRPPVVGAALFAALAFEALKVGFAWYAASFGNYDRTYGSLGFLVASLAFVYLASQVLLLGAEIAQASKEVAAGVPASADYASAREHFLGRAHAFTARLPAVGRKGTRPAGGGTPAAR